MVKFAGILGWTQSENNQILVKMFDKSKKMKTTKITHYRKSDKFWQEKWLILTEKHLFWQKEHTTK